MKYFGELIAQAGYNHALADYNANISPNKGPAPTAPPPPCLPIGLCWVAAPSAGGPGQGLDTDIPGLLDNIGISVPDGDTDKLGQAAAGWSAFVKNETVAGAADTLKAVSSSFLDTSSPEVQDIQDHLQTLQGGVGKIIDSADELAKQAQDHADALHDLRKAISDLITALSAALATTIIIAVAFTFLSAGLSDEAGTAAGAAEIGETAGSIRGAITGSRLFQVLGKIFKGAEDVEKAGNDLEEIDELEAEDIEDTEAGNGKPEPESNGQDLSELFENGQKPKASDLEKWAEEQGWTKQQTENGPPKYVDQNGIVRVTIKQGTPRAPGSEDPHIEIRDAEGNRIDPFGNPVTRRSPGNHTPIEWDLGG